MLTPGMAGRALSAIVRICGGHALKVIAVVFLLSCAAALYLVRDFSIDTDSAKLISGEIPWRKRDAAFDAAFPQGQDQIVVVIDAPTPELAEAATAALADRLSKDKTQFRTVRRPDGGAFFDRNGLLFLPREDLASLMEHVIAGQPLLGSLAADPSLRGLMSALSLALEGVRRGDARLDDLAVPLQAIGASLGSIEAGSPQPLSWRKMITQAVPDRRELRRFILVQPVLDYNSLSPGAAAGNAIRQAAADLDLTPAHNVSVRLTGPVPLEDEEFGTLAEGAGPTAALTLFGLTLLLWLGLRSMKMVLSVLATVVVGLIWTAAVGLALLGPFNLISIAFTVLFVGLGVDFGIQFCVRFRDERRQASNMIAALAGTGAGVGPQLALAAIAIAAGFFAFLPTDYRGVSDLGVIAGTGMIIAFGLNVTLLPALLRLAAPSAAGSEAGYRFLAPVDRFMADRRRWVLALFAGLSIGSLALLPRLPFDFNPIDLKSPETQSVATLLDLMRDPDTTPNTIDVMAPSVSAAQALASRLGALPEVAQAVTLASFIPDDQDAKLAEIGDAAMLVGYSLSPSDLKPDPSDKADADKMGATATALRQAAAGRSSSAAIAAERLADELDKMATGAPALRASARALLLPGLKTLLDQLRTALQAAPVAAGNLPPDLVRDWVAADGRARVQLFPKGDSNDNGVLRRFAAAVRAVAPDATGAPISIQESGRTIVAAFEQAALWAALAIALLLALVLRRAGDVLRTMAPLALAGLLTLGTCVVIGEPLNFANIIALPLHLGVGVAFNIYFVMAWRAGIGGFLQSSLTRAILFSALATGTTFGSLCLSHHPGTASMGRLLVISLTWTLVSALIFLPALLGRPAREAEARGAQEVPGSGQDGRQPGFVR
ncbi:MMPL family transporter [Hypericibacter sp.]|uniref:hopanoid transporter HpnN n=1 Tax=Hypericibacter sp. TaxID=2705401 RepID=UPI003D6D760C